MATVDRAVTPTTVRSVSRSRVGDGGRTDEIASAAEAPQIATAPAVSTPNSGLSFRNRDSTQPAVIVKATPSVTTSTTLPPSDIT